MQPTRLVYRPCCMAKKNINHPSTTNYILIYIYRPCCVPSGGEGSALMTGAVRKYWNMAHMKYAYSAICYRKAAS